jgi:hypothetical protein
MLSETLKNMSRRKIFLTGFLKEGLHPKEKTHKEIRYCFADEKQVEKPRPLI